MGMPRATDLNAKDFWLIGNISTVMNGGCFSMCEMKMFGDANCLPSGEFKKIVRALDSSNQPMRVREYVYDGKVGAADNICQQRWKPRQCTESTTQERRLAQHANIGFTGEGAFQSKHKDGTPRWLQGISQSQEKSGIPRWPKGAECSKISDPWAKRKCIKKI